ncbi:MAG: GNAT family N-acetyltransferase [Micromonosporaceae bacterium]
MITYSQPDLRDVAADVVALFAEVFAEPPYHETDDDAAAFARVLERHARQPGFRLVTAQEADRLIGFAYGCTRPAGWWWRDCDSDPPADIRDAEKFVVYEWAVSKPHRGTGVGRKLFEQLLDQRPEWTTLTVNRDADAYGIYLRHGWVEIDTCHFSGKPPMAVMAKRPDHVLR